MGMIITVDGPSGAGKGTLCYALAEKLGFTLLDSGAIYRVTALAALKRHADLTDEEGLAELARHLDIQFIPKNGEVNVLLGDGCESFNPYARSSGSCIKNSGFSKSAVSFTATSAGFWQK